MTQAGVPTGMENSESNGLPGYSVTRASEKDREGLSKIGMTPEGWNEVVDKITTVLTEFNRQTGSSLAEVEAAGQRMHKKHEEKEAPKPKLLKEAPGVENRNGTIVIEVKDAAVKAALIGPDGNSKATSLFEALTNTEPGVIKDDQPVAQENIPSVKMAALGGKEVQVNMAVRLERKRKGVAGATEDAEVVKFVPTDSKLSAQEEMNRAISIKVVREESPLGVPQSKVFLEINQPKREYKFGESMAEVSGIQTEINRLSALLDETGTSTPSETLKAQRNEWAAQKDKLMQDLAKEQAQGKDLETERQTRRDLSTAIGLIIERQQQVNESIPKDVPADDFQRTQLEMLTLAREVLEVPAGMMNPRKTDKDKPQEAADLDNFVRKVSDGTPVKGKAEQDKTGLPDITIIPDVVPQVATPAVETPNLQEKSKEQLVEEFNKEIDHLKDLHTQKAELEAKIAELSKAGTEVLSKEDKEKLDTLKNELQQTQDRIAVVKALGELGLVGFASERSRSKLGTEPVTAEQLAEMSLAKLFVLLSANQEALTREAEKKVDDKTLKEKLDKVNLMLQVMHEMQEESQKKFNDKEYKGKPGIEIITTWLTAKEEKQKADIAALEAKTAEADNKSAQNEGLLNELKTQLEAVNNQIAESETKAQAILAVLAGKMSTEEWLVLVQKLQDAHGGKFEGNPEDAPKKAEAEANAAVAANCLRRIDLDLEQRAEPETSKIKKFFKRAAEVMVSVFGGIAARTAVKAVLVGTLGLALGGPVGLAVGGIAGALAGGASNAIFGTWMHYKVFHNDKMHAVYTENANPGRMDIFRKRIYDKANEIYQTQARIQNVAVMYNAMVTGQIQPNQLTAEQKQQVLTVVKDARFMKLATNYIGVNHMGLPNDLFKGQDGQPVAVEDALRDFATRFDNFVNGAINANQLAETDVAAALKDADADAKVKVDQVITAASWTKFFKGALIGGVSGFISQGISNALEGHGFFGTTAGTEATATQSGTLSETQLAGYNSNVEQIYSQHGAEQIQYIKDGYHLNDQQVVEIFNKFDVNQNGLLDNNEIVNAHNALEMNFGGGAPHEAVNTVTGWAVPDSGDMSTAVPKEWVDTWTKGIYDVGRGHDFHGAVFSLEGTPGDHQYALAKALDFMEKNVAVNHMNSEEAGILTSHLYGHLLVDGNATDADLAAFAQRVVERYSGTDHDLSGILGTSATEIIPGGTVTTVSIDGLMSPWEAATREASTVLVSESPSTMQTVGDGVGNFIVDTTRKVSELGTTGALAGMGLAMWAGAMYTPENREFGGNTKNGAPQQGNGSNGNGGQQTPPAPGATPVGPNNQPPQAPVTGSTPQQSTTAEQQTSGLRDIPATTPEAATTLKPFGKVESPGVGVSADSEMSNPNVVNINSANGRFVASTPVWVRGQTGEVSAFAYKHPRLAELYKNVLSIGNFIKQYAKTTLGQNGDPFEQQVLNDIKKSVAANDKYAVRRHDGASVGVASTQVYNLDPYRARDYELAAGQNLRELNDSVRNPLAKFVKRMLEVEFAGAGNALGQQHLGDIDREVLNMYMQEGGEKYINQEQVHAFLALLMVLNDPENINGGTRFLNEKGTQEFNGIVNVMIARESAWMAMLSPKFNGQNYLGSAFLVSDAIIRSALEMSGFNVKPNQREARQYFTNVDQIARSVALVKGGSPYSNALQLISIANQNGIEHFASLREQAAQERAQRKANKKKKATSEPTTQAVNTNTVPVGDTTIKQEEAPDTVVIGTQSEPGTSNEV